MTHEPPPAGDVVPRLTQVGRALTYATSVDEALRLTVECAADLLGTDPVLLMLLNDEGALEIRAAHGFEADSQHRFAEPMDELLIDRLRAIFGAAAAERFIGVPLVVAGQITGIIAATRAPDSDERHAEWLLSSLADQASVALDTARQADARARLETRLEQAEAAISTKDHALRILSHDLRTPLSTIVSYTELLDSGMLGPVTDRQRSALGRMRESGQHLIGLLQNVLEMTRLTAGAIQLEPQPFDLRSALREAVDVAVRPGASQHSFSIHAEQPIAAFADPVRVRQVFIHLIDNVLKYTPPGTHVALECTLNGAGDGRRALVRFKDDGPGIPPDQLARIVEPFHRAQNGANRGPPGSGLGLAIARALIE
ncbi:MAG TPA: ATP-binding protein, partial [Longimicrobiales bacterium]